MSNKKTEEKQQIIEEVIKINKWDAAAVKHALDDAVKNALLSERLQFQEHFALINTRLFLCSLSVAVAVLAHGWDYTHPFPESRPVLLLSVIAYFVIMGLLTVHTTFREMGTFLVATQKDVNGQDLLWEASSDMKKYDDKYELKLTVSDTKAVRTGTLNKSCANFIDVNGIVLEHLVAHEVNRLYNSLSGKIAKS